MAFSRKAKYRKPRKAPGARTKSKKVTTVTTVSKPRRTMSMYRNPEYSIFPMKKNVVFKYKFQSALVGTLTTSLNYNFQNLRLNSMFDPDMSNYLGNKSALFKDVLLTANGPYKNYKVNAWKVKLTLLNLSNNAIYVYYDPAAYDNSEADTQTEMQTRRGVSVRTLTGQANSRPSCVINSYGSLKRFAPGGISSSENYSADYGANPSKLIVGTLLWAAIDPGAVNYNVCIQCELTQYATLYNADSTASA